MKAIKLEDGVLFQGDENCDINLFMYRMNQLPHNWFLKAYKLHRDAIIVFKKHHAQIDKILKELKNKNFNIDKSLLREFEFEVNIVLEENEKLFLPDFQVFYMLTSLCYENILKGILILLEKDFQNFDILPKKLKSHNLIELSKMANIKFNSNELVFLEKINSIFSSYTRYPIDLKYEKINKKMTNYDYGEISSLEVLLKGIKKDYKREFRYFNSISKKLDLYIQSLNEKNTELINNFS